MDREEMIKKARTVVDALRCSSQVLTNTTKCGDCPYRFVEEIKEGIPVKPDYVADGIGYWVSCDADAICNDGADLIEDLLDMMSDDGK